MKSIELFDETLDINSTENYELALQAGPDGFGFCLLDTLRNKFVLIRAYEPEESKYFNSENISEFISKDDFLTRKYRKTAIVVPSSRFTVVPAPLFDPAKKDEYFKFNHKWENDLVILSNRNNDPDIVVVYAITEPFHDVIRRFYPGVHPCVHIIPLFDNISRERRSAHGRYIHIHVERDYFNLIIFQSNDLKFCNTFHYRNISDILYFVLNVFNKLEIKQDETIHFSGMTEKYDDLSSNFSIYVRNIKFAEPSGNFTFSYVFNDIELHRYLNLFSVFNCV
ncbi:MAG TPA: DUF3822 family protein [Bacteroidales bacterium]|nr:DUF3822 family protein [Bacteroidales bacterium]